MGLPFGDQSWNRNISYTCKEWWRETVVVKSWKATLEQLPLSAIRIVDDHSARN